MTTLYSGPELYERVMVRKLTNNEGGTALGVIPLEVDGLFLNGAIGEDGVVHLSLKDLHSTVAEAKKQIAEQMEAAEETTKTGPPNRATRRANAKKAPAPTPAKRSPSRATAKRSPLKSV